MSTLEVVASAKVLRWKHIWCTQGITRWLVWLEKREQEWEKIKQKKGQRKFMYKGLQSPKDFGFYSEQVRKLLDDLWQWSNTIRPLS